jgi:hypothetical protein
MKAVLWIVLIVSVLSVAAVAQADQRVEAIRKIAQDVEKMVAECEGNGEESETFLTELTVNRNNGSYPAVGTYRSTAKFYYTYGDRERNPYPDRLLKAVVTTKRAARDETAEFLFDQSGDLIFWFAKDDERELRVYFERGRAFQATDRGKALSGPKISAAGTEALAGARRIQGVFKHSLNF